MSRTKAARRSLSLVYSYVKSDLGKAAEAYAELRPLMRGDTQLRAEIGIKYPWQSNAALAVCLISMREVDQAAAIVARLAPFHRASDEVWVRARGLVIEAELALARGATSNELRSLIEREMRAPVMDHYPRRRTELRMELGRLRTLSGDTKNGQRELKQALHEATASGDLRTARLAQAALDGR